MNILKIGERKENRKEKEKEKKRKKEKEKNTQNDKDNEKGDVKANRCSEYNVRTLLNFSKELEGVIVFNVGSQKLERIGHQIFHLALSLFI